MYDFYSLVTWFCGNGGPDVSRLICDCGIGLNLYAFADWMWNNAIRFCRIPGALSKVIEPNLTTINYPGYEMGQVAAQHLINRLNGSVVIKTANTILLHSELMIRASSKRKK